MTQGFLLFAHDNEQIQYTLLAAWQAKRIARWLGKPVSLVTDQKSLSNLIDTSMFDQVIISDTLTGQRKLYNGQGDSTVLTFKNVDRVAAWELTPYDETIVMDTDIVIQTDRLNVLWGHEDDILVCKNSSDVFGRKFAGFDYLSNYGIEFYWATLFYFKKNDVSKIFFDTCNRIKQQYNWYAFVYDITGSYVRNDYIWSIALHELGGKAAANWATKIPVNLPFVLDKDRIASMTNNSIVVSAEGQLALLSTDVHVMNKFDLIEYVTKEMANV